MAREVEPQEWGSCDGFAVVQERIIGVVEFGGGDLNPIQAALMIIGRDGDEGRYKFPGPGEGQDVVVEITYVERSLTPASAAADKLR